MRSPHQRFQPMMEWAIKVTLLICKGSYSFEAGSLCGARLVITVASPCRVGKFVVDRVVGVGARKRSRACWSENSAGRLRNVEFNVRFCELGRSGIFGDWAGCWSAF